MTHSIMLSPDGKYVILKMVGDIDSEMAFHQVVESHALGAKHGISCFLVDATEARSLSTPSDDYALAHHTMKSNPSVNPNARVALLVSSNDHSHDFIETVSINAGLNTRLFRDRVQAIEFLILNPNYPSGYYPEETPSQ